MATVALIPYHKPCRCTTDGTELDPLSYIINAPRGPQIILYGPSWLDRVDNKPSIKADLLIYTSFVIVSRQCTVLLQQAIKWISILVRRLRVFTNPVTFLHNAGFLQRNTKLVK